MRTKVDRSPESSVVLCACGWRDIARNRMGALLKAAEHERVMHPRDTHARAMLHQLRRTQDQQPA